MSTRPSSAPPERTEELVERVARALAVQNGRAKGNCDCKRCRDAVYFEHDNALAALQSLGYAEMGWQPIETAPKDGTSILAIWQWNADDPNCGAGTHEVVRWCGWWDANGFTQPDPSHWMPLPEPPRTALRGDQEQGEG
jgi:hypothetical protein